MLRGLELKGVGHQDVCATHNTNVLRWCYSCGEDCLYAQVADVCLTNKNNQRTLRRQVACKFEGKGHIPFVAKDQEKRHGRDNMLTLRAKEAADHIKENWPCCAWIMEVNADTTTHRQTRLRQHQFITSLRTAPKALLRQIRQRSSIGNEWHWARDVQLGEDAHRYANRNGVPVFAFLRMVVMNLRRRGD